MLQKELNGEKSYYTNNLTPGNGFVVFYTYKSDGTRDMVALVAAYNYRQGGKRKCFCLFNQAYGKTGYVSADGSTFKIPPNCYCAATAYYIANTEEAQLPEVILDGVQPILFSGNFKLFIDKKDTGRAEGYLDVTNVYNGTINLSGTLSDDTEFSYDLPIKD